MNDELKKALDELTDRLFNLIGNEDLSDEDLREASEGLLPNLFDALNKAGFGTPPTGPEV